MCSLTNYDFPESLAGVSLLTSVRLIKCQLILIAHYSTFIFKVANNNNNNQGDCDRRQSVFSSKQIICNPNLVIFSLTSRLGIFVPGTGGTVTGTYDVGLGWAFNAEGYVDRPPHDNNEFIAHFKMTRTISYRCDVSQYLLLQIMLMRLRDFVVKQSKVPRFSASLCSANEEQQ